MRVIGFLLIPFILSARKSYKRKVGDANGQSQMVASEGTTKLEAAQSFICHFKVSFDFGFDF
jgi:hypothetical protein